jgi:hypothetical protein
MVLRLSGASFAIGPALRSRIDAIARAFRGAVMQPGRARVGIVAFSRQSHGGSIVIHGRSDERYRGLCAAAGGALVRGIIRR